MTDQPRQSSETPASTQKRHYPRWTQGLVSSHEGDRHRHNKSTMARERTTVSLGSATPDAKRVLRAPISGVPLIALINSGSTWGLSPAHTPKFKVPSAQRTVQCMTMCVCECTRACDGVLKPGSDLLCKICGRPAASLQRPPGTRQCSSALFQQTWPATGTDNCLGSCRQRRGEERDRQEGRTTSSRGRTLP